MIKLENWEVVGWEHVIRGMRNPMNSWEKSDSVFGGKFSYGLSEDFSISLGPNDHKLMMNLASGGPVHAKYRRMITVYVDITAPLYWWKEFDTYKVGTVANSCSTMHKIHAKEFTLDDFSHGKLIDDRDFCWQENAMSGGRNIDTPLDILRNVIYSLNVYREKFIETKDKLWWDQMIQLLPTSYNQKRTIMLNYEVLTNIYNSRKNHKLDEWKALCNWIKELPYSELITGEVNDNAQTTLL